MSISSPVASIRLYTVDQSVQDTRCQFRVVLIFSARISLIFSSTSGFAGRRIAKDLEVDYNELAQVDVCCERQAFVGAGAQRGQ